MVGSQVANKLKLGSFHDSGRSMDDTCHLTVIIDSSPQQWYKSAAPPTSAATDPLSFETFMPQLLAFLNAHLALKHENTLSVIGAYPGKRFASNFAWSSSQRSFCPAWSCFHPKIRMNQ